MRGERKGLSAGGAIRPPLGYWLLYTLLFLALAAALWSWFSQNGISFIRTSDAWSQHYKAFVYTVQYYRNIIRGLLRDHSLTVAGYNFALGYGADIMTTLGYYSMGDPLVLLGIPVPSGFLYEAYCFLIFLRAYLAGLAFSAVCFYPKMSGDCVLKVSSWAGVLCGSFIYIGNTYFFLGGFMHPFFLNAMIYFPLIVLGSEKFLMEGRTCFFTLSVFMAALSNFYFLYMLALTGLMYFVWRCLTLYRISEWKIALGKAFRLAFSGLTGVLMAAFLLYPVLLRFFADARMKNESSTGLLYPLSYYRKMVEGFVSYSNFGSWTLLGYGGIALAGVILLFTQKKLFRFKAAFLVLTLLLGLPVFGSLMNGFSYAANRWTWAYGMLIAYLPVRLWPLPGSLSRKRTLLMWGLLACYAFVCCLLTISWKRNTWSQIFLAFGGILLFFILGKSQELSVCRRRGAEAVLVLLSLLCVVSNGYACFSRQEYAMMDKFRAIDRVGLKEITDALAVASVGDKSGFYRFGGTDVSRNSGLWENLSSTQYYWSLSDPSITRFLTEMENRDTLYYMYNGLDERTYLTALAAVKYYTTRDPDGSCLPFGFEQLKRRRNIYIYQNSNPLPLGYTYEKRIEREYYDSLPVWQKQEALLQGILLDQPSEKAEVFETVYEGEGLTFLSRACPFELCEEQGLEIEDRGEKGILITANRRNASVNLAFEGLENSETCLRLTGISYQPIKDTDEEPLDEIPIRISCFGETEEERGKELTYYTPSHRYYNGHQDYFVNLGYRKDPRDQLRLSFPLPGSYYFSGMEVICQPMDNYEQLLNERKQSVLERIDLHANQSYALSEVTGSVNLDEPKLLCLAMPFSEGWSAWVDEEQEELLQANTMYMALPLDAGEHKIRLVYQTPGSRVGIFLTLTGWFFFVILQLFSRRPGVRGRMNEAAGTFVDAYHIE